MSATVPSYKVFQYGIGVEAALVRPAKLRGLPPDSTLVLVNGKRRHRFVGDYPLELWPDQRFAWNGYRLHPVPSSSNEWRCLRDGAGAQYGSDAVAGVLNFVLRDAPEGGTIETRLGQYYQG